MQPGIVIEYIIRVICGSDIFCLPIIGFGLMIVHDHDIVIGVKVKMGRGCKMFNGEALGN